MHQVKIRHPIEGDYVDTLFDEMESSLDDDAREFSISQRKVVLKKGESIVLVAVKESRIVGLTRFVTWRDRAWMRLLFVLSEFRSQGIEELLLKEAIQRLNESRISIISHEWLPSSLLPSAALLSAGFKTLTRAFMEGDVEACAGRVVFPAGYAVRNWGSNLIDDFAATLHKIFAEPNISIDAVFAPEYSTLEGVKKSLKESSEGKRTEDLGIIDTETTLLLLHEGKACGVSECYNWEEVKRDDSGEIIERVPMGFVRMLGLLPEYRGKGLGGLLMRRILKGYADEGVKGLRLWVTVENASAFNLYKKLGFRDIGERSTVYYWNKLKK